MANKVALVTGANKGIGYAIARELCRRGVRTVYVGSRDLKRGQDAIEKLNNEGLKAEVAQLEVTDPNSVKALADQLKVKHGGIDILVNNAGVSPPDMLNATYENAKYVINVNYGSALIIQQYLFPILNENARVINVSSDCGHISNIKSKKWIDKLTSEDLKVNDVNEFVNWYLDSLKNGTLKKEDFAEIPLLDYRISKVALTALTRIQQKEVKRNISVNAIHPGFVQTDMTNGRGVLTLEEAGKAPVYLALDAPQELKGAYVWYDQTVYDWTDYNLELYCRFENIKKGIAHSF